MTVRFTRNGDSNGGKVFVNAENYKGYFVVRLPDGHFQPMFDTQKMSPAEKVKARQIRNVDTAIARELSHTLILFEGAADYTIIDITEEKAREAAEFSAFKKEMEQD